MKIAWNLELIAGLAGAALGLISWTYILFGPMYSYARADTEGRISGGTTNLVMLGLQPITVVFLALMLLSLIGTGLGAYLHSQRDSVAGQVFLWESAAVLLIGAVAGLASVGVFFFPSVLLALVAAVASGRSGHKTPSTS